jgi:hypothetical protein
VFAYQHAAVVAPLPLHWATDGAVPTLQLVCADAAAFGTVARLLTASCRAETLGQGRDQVDRTPYRAIELVRTFRTEHLVLFRWYAMRRSEMSERLAFASTPHAAVLRPDELVKLHVAGAKGRAASSTTASLSRSTRTATASSSYTTMRRRCPSTVPKPA